MASPIEIRTELLSVLARCAYDDETRPHLCAVIFRDDEAIATNGHMLVRARLKTNGHKLAVPRATCFAAVAAQDAAERHHSIYALRLGVDLEAGIDGDSIIQEAPHGNRSIFIEPDGERLRLDLANGVTMSSRQTDVSKFPDIEKALVTGRTGDPDLMHFDTKYLDALDLLARASGYYHRGVRCEAWDEAGAMQWVMPPDPNHEDDPVRVVIMRMRGRDALEKKATAGKRILPPRRMW